MADRLTDEQRARDVRDCLREVADSVVDSVLEETKEVDKTGARAEVAAALFDVACRLCVEARLDPAGVREMVMTHLASLDAARSVAS